MYRFIFLLPYVFCFFYTLFVINNRDLLVGEFEGFSINEYKDLSLLIYAFVSLIFFVLLEFFYLFSSRLKFSRLKININLNRLNIFFFVITTANFLFLINTGVGIVGGENKHPLSFLFFIFNPTVIFPFWYLYTRLNKGTNFFFFINTIIFIALKLSQGWSSFIVMFFIFEVYLFFKKKRKMWVYIISPFFALMLLPAGAIAYQYIYPLKMMVRGVPEPIPEYHEALDKLTNRLTFASNAIAALEREQSIIASASEQSRSYAEIISLLRPIVPGFLGLDKDFRTNNNLLVNAYYPGVVSSTSSDMGLVAYSYLLAKGNILEFFIWLFLSILLFLLLRLFISLFEKNKGEMNPLYYYYIFYFYVNASLEQVFGYGFLSIFYILPFMCLFKVSSFKFIYGIGK